MFRYFRGINRRINDTLNVYHDLGKLGFPLFKGMLVLISFLIVTASIAIIMSFFDKDNVSMDADSIWINYSLPIIIYGVICPFISTLISLVFKMFLEINISNIINKYKYTKKKEGKSINLFKEIFKIVKFIACSKISIYILSSVFFLLLPFNYVINIVLMITFIFFCVLRKLIEYYDNTLDCYIESMEKCYTDDSVYWRYNINVKYPHEERRVVTKRFSEFKKLHNDLELDENLPTENWIKPFQVDEAEERGKKLNTYMNNILTNKDVMSDSIFYSFFKEKKHDVEETKPLIIERKTLKDSLDEEDEENIQDKMLKIRIKSIISEEISKIFILHEVNYYTSLKKRFFVMCNNNLFKLKYDKFYNKFYIRAQVYFNDIYSIEKTKIANTQYLKDKEVLIIKYDISGEVNKFILTSLSSDKYHNINTLFEYLKDKLKESKCKFSVTNNFKFDNGMGISEKIHHNNITKSVKKIVTSNILKSKSYIRNLW